VLSFPEAFPKDFKDFWPSLKDCIHQMGKPMQQRQYSTASRVTQRFIAGESRSPCS